MRPAGAAAGSSQRASVADGEFTELLELARGGAIGSDRAVELADGAALEPATLAQVARALDLAHARGSRRAVVVAEGRSFIADIQSRRLERLETRDDFVFEEVDSAIAIRGESATFATRALGPRALPPREIAEQFDSLKINGGRAQRASA